MPLLLPFLVICMLNLPHGYIQENISYINTIGIKMVSVPAGHFNMGQSASEWDEWPVHEVVIFKLNL